MIWAPGNHELWTHPRRPGPLRGEERYRHLVELCRGLGVRHPGGPVPGVDRARAARCWWRRCSCSTTTRSGRRARTSKEEALARAHEAGVVCTDEFLLHPDPYPSRDAWCRARVALTERRLTPATRPLPTVLVNHFPLVREPTASCATRSSPSGAAPTGTADWHRRFRAARRRLRPPAHPPDHLVRRGPLEEVSLGYPREWRPRPRPTRGCGRYAGARPGLTPHPSTRRFFCTLPIALRGSASTRRTSRGRLCTDSSRRDEVRSAPPRHPVADHVGHLPAQVRVGRPRPRPPVPPDGPAAPPRPRRRRPCSRRS